MLAPALIALALAAAPAPPQPADEGGLAWLCERTWKRGRIEATVARYLTASGRQQEMYVEFYVGGSSGLLLGGFAAGGKGEASLANWSAWVGWSKTVRDSLGFTGAQIVLGPVREGQLPPNAAHSGSFASDIDMKWRELRRLARGGKIEAGLIDEKGHVHASGVVDVRRVAIAEAEAKRLIALSRADVPRYRSRCVPFDDRITVN